MAANTASLSINHPTTNAKRNENANKPHTNEREMDRLCVTYHRRHPFTFWALSSGGGMVFVPLPPTTNEPTNQTKSPVCTTLEQLWSTRPPPTCLQRLVQILAHSTIEINAQTNTIQRETLTIKIGWLCAVASKNSYSPHTNKKYNSNNSRFYRCEENKR